MTCPFLEYRGSSGEYDFDPPRAYCTAAEGFVQPLRADICNDRYDFAHDEDCEIYLEHAEGAGESGDSGGEDGDGS